MLAAANASVPRGRCIKDAASKNTGKTTQAEIAQGLLSVFNAATDDELGKFSKHLSGMAFDVQPVEHDAEKIKQTIRGLSGLDKYPGYRRRFGALACSILNGQIE